MAESVAVIRRVLSSGSSFSSLVETAPGRRYVMKLSGAGPGKRALATEFVARNLARHLGLNVPATEVLDLPSSFPWQTGTDEAYEAVQRSVGPNLGVAFIPDADDLKAVDLTGLPADFVGCLAAVDALLQNVDRTTANPNILRDGVGACWAIDFGACLLIERIARGSMEPRLRLPPSHFLNSARVSYSVPHTIARIDRGRLAAIIEALPAPWLEDLALTEAGLVQRLTAYLASASRGAD